MFGKGIQVKLQAICALALGGLVLAGCTDGTSGGSTANRHVLVTNASGMTITNFYGSNAGTSSWEEDILGSGVLSPGGTANINFDDGSGYCDFDVKAVFEDGSSVVRNGVDVCTTTELTIN